MRRIISTRTPCIWHKALNIAFLTLLLPIVVACVTAPPSNTPFPTATPGVKLASTACALPTIVVPTLPAQIPHYAELDSATGLHVTGQAQDINLGSYRLEVSGKVNRPLSLSYDDLRCMPRLEARPSLICPKYFEDVATWAGASLKHVLELADIQAGATEIKLISADGYFTTVPLETARSDKNFLAYEWEGKPLPKLHGFPARAVFPDLTGNKWVKWLIKIEVK